VRSTGVSRSVACGFRTDLYFADAAMMVVLRTRKREGG
jgi:hypothetical protein